MSMVTEQMSDSEPFELTTIGVEGDDATCACAECDGDADEFTLILSADMRGMVADFGEVGFCSYECVESFHEMEFLRITEAGADEVVYWGDTVVVEVEVGGVVVSRSIGHDKEAAVSAFQDTLDDLSLSGFELDELTVTFDQF